MRQVSRFRGQGSSRGSVMVEFTLVLPFLVLLFLGAIGFGYNFHIYNRLEESVRAGARYGSMATYDAYNSKDPEIPPCALGPCAPITLSSTNSPFQQHIENIVVYGTPIVADPPPQPVVEGMTPANVSITLGIYGMGPDNPVAITSVSVAVKDVSLRLLGGTITLNKPITTFTYVGTYAPADIKKK